MSRHTWWPLLFILSLAVALFLRFYQLGQVPSGLFPDEATHALDALQVLDGELSLYSPDEGSTGALWRYLLALDFAMFGPSILSLRALASALGVLSVGMAYLVVRELGLAPPGGWWVRDRHPPTRSLRVRDPQQALGLPLWHASIAALAALLLAVSYWHLDLSRTAFSAVLMLLVQDAAFFCLWRALASGRQPWFALFGLGLGLLVYNYLPGKLAPAVPLVFFLLEWVMARRAALVVRYARRLLAAAGIGLAVALPFLLFALFNYQILIQRAALPVAGGIAAASPVAVLVANLAAFGLWPTAWLPAHWGALFLGPLLSLCFVAGVIASLVRLRRPAYLFLLVWWLVMLLPGVLAPEGAIPNPRRAIGAATPTFALAALGLATLASWVLRAGDWVLRAGDRREWTPRAGDAKPGSGAKGWGRGALAITLAAECALVVYTGAATYQRYFVRWGPSEAARLAFHVYDLELADIMARESGAETVYLLPLDSSAGIINPLLDSITFVYRGQAAYDFLPDDEATMLDRLARLTAGKRIARLVRWKVTKHTGADPKGVAHYYLEKWGRRVDVRSYPYFDIETYALDRAPGAFTPTPLTPAEVVFEGQMALTGYAFPSAAGGPAEQPAVAMAGDWLWAELAWRKTGDLAGRDHQVALRLEDAAGHLVGQVDKPLLDNLWHRGTAGWPSGAQERDYYLLPVDPAAAPGLYRLKAVLYTTGDGGRRLAPALPGVGADLAVELGQARLVAPATPPDAADLPIPQRLDLDLGGGLRLLGFDRGFGGPLRPGDRATLSLWWQARTPLAVDLALVLGAGQPERAWPLSQPQPLGGKDYPTRAWPAGAVVRTFVDLRLPPDVEAGDYNLGLRLLAAEDGTPLSDWVLGGMQVVGRARSFEEPAMSHRVGADFGGQIRLLGYDLDLARAAPGGSAELTLYWQAQREVETSYTVFVHLLDEAGRIVGQVDRVPGAGEAPTTGWLAGEVVTDAIPLPISEAAAAARSIAVGLYDPVTGKRLPAAGNAAGEPAGDQVALPIR